MLGGGLLVGILMRLGKRSGGDVDTGNIDGIDSIKRTEIARIESERASIGVEGDALDIEVERLRRERSLNGRSRELLKELEKRLREKAD